MNISLSSNIKNKPKDTKYIPAKYHNVNMLKVLAKKNRVINEILCNRKTSVNII